MRHFSAEQWADFVRKALKKKDMQETQSHLEAGCEQCNDDLAAWTRVRDLAARERAFEPPAVAVKMAKAAMKLHGQAARVPVAKLLFDSINAPTLAGIRSSGQGARQMLYGFEEYRVDLRFEPNLDADQALLVGQVLKAGNVRESLGNITASLARGGEVLGFAKANAFGEFQLECDLRGRVELHLILPDGNQMRVPIVEPTTGGTKDKSPQLAVPTTLTAKGRARRKSTRK